MIKQTNHSCHSRTANICSSIPPAFSRAPAVLSVLFMFTMVFTSCGQNDDQRAFEEQAFSLAENITETDPSGKIVTEDPDDWRTAPFFQGLVFVNPAFPNPVLVSDRLDINVEITGIEAVSGLRVVVLLESGPTIEFKPLYTSSEQPLPPGLTVASINPVELGRFNTVESARGIHRIILLDNRENVISYGDVRVE